MIKSPIGELRENFQQVGMKIPKENKEGRCLKLPWAIEISVPWADDD